MSERATPDRAHRSRPGIKSYGISSEPEGMLDWSFVDERMAKSRNYWIASTSRRCTPHVSPVWGAWVDGVLYFGSARDAVKTRNLLANPEVVVHLESGDEVVIVEGRAEEYKGSPAWEPIADAYEVKYPGFRPTAPAQDPNAVFFVVKPRAVFAWLEQEYPRTATRWLFG